MPLDEAIEIAPPPQSSEELVRLGCLLSLVMPYELASWMLSQWSGLSVSASSLWNWVQMMGSKAHCAVAVLDFFHAAGQLARLTQALFDDSSSAQAQAWFRHWRHLLRHGLILPLLRALTWLLHSGLLTGPSFTTLLQVQAYFQRHHRHMRYRQFARLQLPLGSGMVESACKWLLQQRFKGVGMRWSESGFNHPLLLRLAFVNQRFDSLFPNVPLPPPSSPNP